jgi:hypothetical protein
MFRPSLIPHRAGPRNEAAGIIVHDLFYDASEIQPPLAPAHGGNAAAGLIRCGKCPS